MKAAEALSSPRRGASAAQLLGFRANAIRTRRRYLAHLRTLPDPLGTLCAEFYEQRVTRVRPKPLLGEYLPWLLADLMGVSARVTERVSECWLPFYLQVLAIDDLLDGSAGMQVELLPIVASVLGEQGHVAYTRLLGADARFWNAFDRHVLRMGAAGAREVQLHRGKITSISSRDWAEVGEKVELIKVCYVSLALASGSEPRDQHLAALEDFATGIQLFDDISDWEEDWAIGNFTPLLSSAVGQGNVPDSLPLREGVLLRLVESGALATCISEGDARLERAATLSGFDPATRGIQFLRSLIADLRALRATQTAVAALVGRQREAAPGVGDDEFLKNPQVRTALQELGATIKVVAQSS